MSNEGKVNITLIDFLKLFLRYILCVIFPPLAVIDQGCGSIFWVFIFTLFGWLPGCILAFYLVLSKKNFYRK